MGPSIASVLPTRGEVVGVAHPVVVTFTAPSPIGTWPRRAIEVKSAPAMTGKFEWLDNDVVQWSRPILAGAQHDRAFRGRPGNELRNGSAVVGIANISEHTFTVSVDALTQDRRLRCLRRTTDSTGEKPACSRLDG